jgi:type II secretory pathway pseudopilin PulG
MELLAAIAIMVLLVAAVAPSLSTAMDLQQHRAARRIAMVYAQLHDEAILRNRTFRIAYHLDEGFYDIEVGDPKAMIFEDAEDAEEGREREEELREEMGEEELKAYMEKNAWRKLDGDINGHIVLPNGTRFGSVYTPQYEEPVLPTAAQEKKGGKKKAAKKGDGEDGPLVVYSYIFSNGFSEYTMLTIVDEEDEEAGYTITVDPLSGKVDFYDEIREEHDVFDDLPDEGPTLSN